MKRGTREFFTQAIWETFCRHYASPPEKGVMSALSHRHFEAMDLRVQKGYRIVFLLRRQMQGDAICFYLISFGVPDGI